MSKNHGGTRPGDGKTGASGPLVGAPRPFSREASRELWKPKKCGNYEECKGTTRSKIGFCTPCRKAYKAQNSDPTPTKHVVDEGTTIDDILRIYRRLDRKM